MRRPLPKALLPAALALLPLLRGPAAAAAPRSEQFLWKSTEALTLPAVLGQFEAFDRGLRGLSARFSQTLNVATTGMNSSVEGTIAYLKPDRLRIQHVKPERQTVVSDGKDIWIYRLSQNQVVQSNLNDWKQADPLIANLMQFGSYSAMLKNYEVRLDTASPAPALLLRPRAKQETPFELRFTLSRATLFPETTELQVGEMRIRSHFEDVEFNPALEESQFRFTPPPGADVFRDFKPPKFKP